MSDSGDNTRGAIEAVLHRLDALDPYLGQIIELRFYGGFALADVADLLDMPRRTVEDDWAFVRAWVARELHRDASGQGSFE